MAENNNDDSAVKQVANQVKDKAKDVAKKSVKEAIKPLLPGILSAVGIFLLCLLAVGVINLIPYLIKDLFNSIFSIFKSNDTSTSAEISQSVIYIDENTGAYKFYVDDLVQQILDELESKEIEYETLGTSEAEFKELLEKYIEAEIKTTYPKTNLDDNDIDGGIIIKRASSITGQKDQVLKYKSYNDFFNSSDIYDCYTIDPKTLEMCIAKQGNSEFTTDFSGKTDGSSGSIIIDRLNYKKYVENYSTPLNFFLALHLISQDTEFMKDVLDMVMPENETDEFLVLTYVDTSIHYEAEYVYSGIDKYSLGPILDTNGEEIEGGNNVYQLWKIDEGEEDKVEYTVTISNENITTYTNLIGYANIENPIDLYTKKSSDTNSGELCLSKADTWIRYYEKNIIPAENAINYDENTPNAVDLKNTILERGKQLDSYVKIKLDDDSNGTTYVYKERYREIYIEKDVDITQTSTKFNLSDKENQLKVDDFVELIRSYPGVENKISTASNNILYMLEQNENTQSLEIIMRYILYRLNDIDYGVNRDKLDDILNGDEEEYENCSKLLVKYLRYWNKEYMSPEISADGKNYIIAEDADGNLVVGYGIKIEDYKQLFIDNDYSVNLGEEVPIEFVDGLEEDNIVDFVKEVEGLVEGLNLTSYQTNALVSRAYNFGESIATEAVDFDFGEGKFEEIYNKYWVQENDDKRKDKDSNADYNHELYKKYLSKSLVNSINSSEQRSSEWTLFQTGYYRELGKWHTSGDDILRVADKIHKYMEDNEYIYCVMGDPNNGCEECEKFERPQHGLNLTFEGSKTGFRNTCCATYVSWVVQELKFIEDKEHQDGARGLAELLEEKGFQIIEDIEDLEPGDILYYDYGHIDIYAGDGTKYNAGSGSSIRGSSPEKIDDEAFRKKFTYGLRAP